MPLKSGSSKKTIQNNIRELFADNKKTGKERGANGKPRSKDQILAIAFSKARSGKKSAKVGFARLSKSKKKRLSKKGKNYARMMAY